MSCTNKKYIRIISDGIKNKLAEHRNLNKPFLNIFNEINKEFYQKVKIEEKEGSTAELFNIYEDRCKYYNDENLHLILDNEMQIAYRNSNNAKKKLKSYDDFINHFARVEAMDFCIREFSINSSLVNMMFIINDFEQFNHLYYFDFLVISKKREIGELYKLKDEIRKRAYPKNKVLKLKLKREYKDLFERKDFYNFITNHFLKDNISNEKFKCFFVYSENDGSKFQFHCNTQEVSFFFKILKEKYYYDFNYSEILESGKFYTNKDKVLNRNMLKQALTRVDEEKEIEKKHFQKLSSYK